MMQLHHMGCAVRSIDDALQQYRNVMGFQCVSDKIAIKEQNVTVCFVETAPGVYMELVQPLGDGPSPVDSFIKKKQVYYHACYEVIGVADVIVEFEQKNCLLLGRFFSEAFNHTECAFLLMPDSSLIELCEKGAFCAFDKLN